MLEDRSSFCTITVQISGGTHGLPASCVTLSKACSTIIIHQNRIAGVTMCLDNALSERHLKFCAAVLLNGLTGEACKRCLFIIDSLLRDAKPVSQRSSHVPEGHVILRLYI